MKRTKNIKVLGAITAFVILLIAVPIVYGGLCWSGIDPHVRVNGADYFVDVSVPKGQWCKLDSPIQVTFLVPVGAGTELVEETVGGPDKCFAHTSTSFQEVAGLNSVAVTVLAGAEGPIPVGVIFRSPSSEVLCNGRANQTFRCG